MSTSDDLVVVGGASGYVGSALLECLKPRFRVAGISRSGDNRTENGVLWRGADLFSLLETRRALEGARYAVYLVHSMSPSVRLTQGRFEDLDLLLADNFARAAAAAKAEQIVYLGGIIPKERPLSRHLASRLEVEKALAAHGVPVTTLRAGLVVGPNASSLPILTTLVRRLPIMLTPKWTRTPTQPIGLDDVLELLMSVIANTDTYGKCFDIGGPQVLTHVKMMRIAAREMGLGKRIMLRVPFLSPGFSKAWVKLITGAPAALVGPLVESLEHPMVVDPQRQLMAKNPEPFEDALRDAIAKDDPSAKKSKRSRPPNTVRSVQRLPLAKNRDATWVADQYRTWLPRFLRPFLRVERGADATLYFHVVGLRTPLLVLDYSEELSTPDRSLYYITGGLLARLRPGERVRGRLEFRVVLDGSYVLAAIHDFAPRLPWFIYSATQALVHLFVMKAFGRHLAYTARP